MNKQVFLPASLPALLWGPRRLVRPLSLFVLPVCKLREPAMGWRV